MPAVPWSVRNIRSSLTIGAVLVLFSIALVRTEAVRVILLDEQMNAPDYVQVERQLPFGTPFATTPTTAADMADAAHAINEQLTGESVHGVSTLAGYLVSSRATGHDLSGSRIGFLGYVSRMRAVFGTSGRRCRRWPCWCLSCWSRCTR